MNPHLPIQQLCFCPLLIAFHPLREVLEAVFNQKDFLSDLPHNASLCQSSWTFHSMTVCHINSDKPLCMNRMGVNPLTLLCGSRWGTNRVMLLFQMLMVDFCKWALELKEHYLWCPILMQTRVQVRFNNMELGLQVKLSWTRERNEQKNSLWPKVSLFAEIGCGAAPWSSQRVVRRKHSNGQHFIRSISSGWPSVEWSQRRRSHVGRGDQPTIRVIHPRRKNLIRSITTDEQGEILTFSSWSFLLKTLCSTQI